jgi:hypothetical protein
MSGNFFVVNFSLSRLLLKCLETKHFFRASARFFKRAWYGDARFERRALTEFSVAREGITNELLQDDKKYIRGQGR